MPNGHDSETRKEKLRRLWNGVVRRYPELGRYGDEPWDAEGNLSAEAYAGYKIAKHEDRPDQSRPSVTPTPQPSAAPLVSTPPPPAPPTAPQHFYSEEMLDFMSPVGEFAASTPAAMGDPPPPTPSIYGLPEGNVSALASGATDFISDWAAGSKRADTAIRSALPPPPFTAEDIPTGWIPDWIKNPALQAPGALISTGQAAMTLFDPDEPQYLFTNQYLRDKGIDSPSLLNLQTYKDFIEKSKADRAAAEELAYEELRKEYPDREPSRLELYTRANQIQAASLSQWQGFVGAALPEILLELLFFRGRGPKSFSELSGALTPPIRPPGAKATVASAMGELISPIAHLEELAGAGIGATASGSLAAGKKITGVSTGTPTGFESFVPTTATDTFPLALPEGPPPRLALPEGMTTALARYTPTETGLVPVGETIPMGPGFTPEIRPLALPQGTQPRQLMTHDLQAARMRAGVMSPVGALPTGPGSETRSRVTERVRDGEPLSKKMYKNRRGDLRLIRTTLEGVKRTPATTARAADDVLPTTARAADEAVPSPTPDDLGLVKKGRYYYPKDRFGGADLSDSPIHKVTIGGRERYLSSLDDESIGKIWYEYKDKDSWMDAAALSSHTMADRRRTVAGPTAYTKRELIDKLEAEAPTPDVAPTTAARAADDVPEWSGVAGETGLVEVKRKYDLTNRLLTKSAREAGLPEVSPIATNNSDAIWLYEAKKIGLDPYELVENFPDSFRSVTSPVPSAAPVLPARRTPLPRVPDETGLEGQLRMRLPFQDWAPKRATTVSPTTEIGFAPGRGAGAGRIETPFGTLDDPYAFTRTQEVRSRFSWDDVTGERGKPTFVVKSEGTVYGSRKFANAAESAAADSPTTATEINMIADSVVEDPGMALVHVPRKPAVTDAKYSKGFPKIDESSFDDMGWAHIFGPGARDWMARVGNKLQSIPGYRFLPSGEDVVRLVNPAAMARKSAMAAEALMYRLVEGQQSATLSYKLARFKGRQPFSVNDAGEINVVEKATGEQVLKPFGDVAENPQQYNLTPVQNKWIEDGWEFIDDLAENYREVSGKTIVSEKEWAREHYWPRFTTKQDPKTKKKFLGVTGEIGERQTPSYQRLHAHMEDAMVQHGVRYVGDPVAQIELYAMALQRMTRDEILIKRLIRQNLARIGAQGEGWVQPAFLKSRGKEVDGEKITRWNKLYIPEESEKYLRLPLSRRRDSALVNNFGFKVGEGTAALSRLLQTGIFDLGHVTLQMVTLPYTLPAKYAEVVVGMLRSMVEPDFLARYFSSPMRSKNSRIWLRLIDPNTLSEVAERASRQGLDVNVRSEFFEAVDYVLSKIPGWRRKWFLPRYPVEAAQRGFNTALSLGKLAHYEAMESAAIWTTGGRKWAMDDELKRLARIADNLVGVPSMKTLGMSARARAIEPAVLLYSSRYTRSGVAIVRYLFGKGVGPEYVRKVMGNLLVGGHLTMMGLAGLVGMSKEEIRDMVDPRTLQDPKKRSRYMAIRVGEGADARYIGIGGTFRWMLQFTASLTPEVAPPQEDSGGRQRPPLFPQTWEETFEKLEKDEYNDVFMRNPIMMAMRSKSSPGILGGGFLSEWIDGSDFSGIPLSQEDDIVKQVAQNLSKQAVERTTPFAVDAYFEAPEEWDLGVKASVVAVEAGLGARTFPERPSTIRDNAAEDAMKRMGIFGMSKKELGEMVGERYVSEEPVTDWQDLPETWKQRVLKSPEVEATQGRLEEARALFGPKEHEFEAHWAQEFEKVVKGLEKAWEDSVKDDPENPGRLYRELRKKLLGEHYTLKAAAKAEAVRDGLFQYGEAETESEKRMSEYYLLLTADDEDAVREFFKENFPDSDYKYAPIEDKVTKEFNWRERDKRIDALIEAYGEGFIEAAQAKALEGMPEIEIKYRNDRKFIEDMGYWEIDKAIAERLNMADMWETYKGLPTGEARKYKDQHIRNIRKIEKLIQYERQEMRRGSPPLQAALRRWGYVTADPKVTIESGILRGI